MRWPSPPSEAICPFPRRAGSRPAPGRPGPQRHPRHAGHDPSRQARLLRLSEHRDPDDRPFRQTRGPLRALLRPDASDPPVPHDAHDRHAPAFHGVRDNGGFVVPSQLKTMAELFKDKGYATGAFIAAYVLDSKWGLDQGFDTYFDKFDLGKFKRISLGTVQRPANEVMAEALPWLEKNKGGKFFAWIHLYDPHSPYDPPPPYDKLYADHPYLGEIAFADSQLRRLWDLLAANGLDRNTVIVFAGDHGESLGEHAEQSHGFFIYQGAIHVPLIVVSPFSKFRGVVAPRWRAWPTSCRRSVKWRDCPSRPRSRGIAWSRPSPAAGRPRARPTARPIIPGSTTAGRTSRASRTKDTSSSWPRCPSSTTSPRTRAKRRISSTSKGGLRQDFRGGRVLHPEVRPERL